MRGHDTFAQRHGILVARGFRKEADVVVEKDGGRRWFKESNGHRYPAYNFRLVLCPRYPPLHNDLLSLALNKLPKSDPHGTVEVDDADGRERWYADRLRLLVVEAENIASVGGV